MLVLTRKADQKIQIGPDITVTVLDVKGRYVRLGIDAPSEVRILRGELNESPAAAAEQHAQAKPDQPVTEAHRNPSPAPHVLTDPGLHHVPVSRPHG